MGLEEKLALIKENLFEVLNPELIERPLAEGRNPRIYWVRLHVPILKPILAVLILTRELLLRAGPCGYLEQTQI
jgi:hypothetical protein